MNISAGWNFVRSMMGFWVISSELKQRSFFANFIEILHSPKVEFYVLKFRKTYCEFSTTSQANRLTSILNRNSNQLGNRKRNQKYIFFSCMFERKQKKSYVWRNEQETQRVTYWMDQLIDHIINYFCQWHRQIHSFTSRGNGNGKCNEKWQVPSDLRCTETNLFILLKTMKPHSRTINWKASSIVGIFNDANGNGCNKFPYNSHKKRRTCQFASKQAILLSYCGTRLKRMKMF